MNQKRQLYIRKGKRLYDYYTDKLFKTYESAQEAYAECIILNNQPLENSDENPQTTPLTTLDNVI